MKKMKLLAWVAYVALNLVATACSDDDETPGLEKYTVTVTAGANGTATADPATCEAGETVTLTATPDEGFLFVKWTVKSGEVTLADATTNPLEITMPRGDVVLEASFAEQIVPYAITLAAVENGTIAAFVGETEVAEAAEGKPVTLTATPTEGYEFAGWTVEGVEIAGGELTKTPLNFTMPANEVLVSATFKKLVNVLDLIEDEIFKAYSRERMGYPDKGIIDGVSYEQPAWDSDADGVLSEAEAAAVRVINIHDGYTSRPDADGDSEYEDEVFASLADLQYFTGLEKLDLGGSGSGYDDDALDLSALENLVYLDLSDNDLYKDFILGNKPELKTLNLYFCDVMSEIDFSACPKLEKCIIETEAEKLDFSGCPALKELEAFGYYYEIDLSGNQELTRLVLSWSYELTNLDISSCVKLTYLDVSRTLVTEVDITKMAFNGEGTYEAYVGSNDDGNEVGLTMRPDQKAHWDDVLQDDDRNSDVNVTVI